MKEVYSCVKRKGIGDTYMEKIKNFIESTPVKVFGAISATLGVISAFLKVFGIVDALAVSIAGIILFVIGLFTIVPAMFFQSEDIKNKQTEIEELLTQKNALITEKQKIIEQNNCLIDFAYNGLEYTGNHVTITFDKDNERYYLQFEKHFKVVTDIVPEYYSAQFYANKYITDKSKAKSFYHNNPISWNDLKVRACVSYKAPNKDSFSSDKNLEIVNIIDNSNFIPFKILYKTYGQGTKINLVKGTDVIIKYCYYVPITYWGSYINRTISFFGEKASVTLKYDNNSKLNYYVSRLKDGSPIDLEPSEYKVKEFDNDEKKNIKISFNHQDNIISKYRITWDAEKYFNKKDLNTEQGVDQLGITDK